MIPGLAQALGERPLITEADIASDVASGAARIVWPTRESGIVVRRIPYATSGEVEFSVGPAGGRMSDIVAAIDPLERWAREINCTQAHIYMGRLGWRRVLEERGYELYQVVMRKLL